LLWDVVIAGIYDDGFNITDRSLAKFLSLKVRNLFFVLFLYKLNIARRVVAVIDES
jgi:hypothetical protein